jgi:ABC-type transport system involved in multi-copper enzyme maturation permease subunit
MYLLITLIKRELMDNLTSSRYALTSILCVVLCLVSIVLMAHDYEARIKRFDSSPEYNIAKPPQPLSLIARGADEVIGRSVQPDGHGRYQVIGLLSELYGEEHHLFDLFTPPDFVYIVSVVLSALAIFLSFDSICGEKEIRTLSLLMSNSLPRVTLLLGKWIGGYLSFLLCLVPALLLMCIYLVAFSSVPMQTEHWIRLLWIVGLSFIYLSIFFTLGLLVSALTHRPAAALILVLFIWAIWTLGVPRVGLLAARTISRTMQEGEHRRAKEEIARGHTISEEMRETMWSMDDAYIASVERQIRIGQNLARISPLASYVYASTTLGQSGIDDYLDYLQRLKLWVRENARREGSRAVRQWTKFAHRTLALDRSLSRIAFDVLWLVLWNICLFMGANLAFLKYDVR